MHADALVTTLWECKRSIGFLGFDFLTELICIRAGVLNDQ